jgi:hypothetical protein
MALIGAACLPCAAPVHTVSAQPLAADSIVRVHVITLDSTWYVTGHLVAITGESVVVRTDSGRAQVAFERIHVLSVERRKRTAGVGHSALVGCGIVGGGLGLLGALGTAFGHPSGDDDIEGPNAAIFVATLLGVGGCALGATIGALVGAARHYTWDAITLPPRTGTDAASPA